MNESEFRLIIGIVIGIVIGVVIGININRSIFLEKRNSTTADSIHDDSVKDIDNDKFNKKEDEMTTTTITTTTTVSDDMCIMCHEYYGLASQDSKCSICYLDKRRIQHINVNLKAIDIDMFDQTSIHDSYIGKCCICKEENKEIINHFYCSCIEIPCRACNKLVDFCPVCATGKYYQIEQKHIFMLLDAMERKEINGNYKPIIRAWTQIMKDIDIKLNENFSLHQMYAKTSDIDFCINSRYPNLQAPSRSDTVASQKCNIFNSIYCLSLVPIKMTIKELGYVLCYKGYFGDEKITFKYSQERRRQGDHVGLYAIEFPK